MQMLFVWVSVDVMLFSNQTMGITFIAHITGLNDVPVVSLVSKISN